MQLNCSSSPEGRTKKIINKNASSNILKGKISKSQRNSLAHKVSCLRKHLTVDFPRKIGSFDKLGFWKCIVSAVSAIVGPLATEGIDYANRCLFMYLFVDTYIFVHPLSATNETLSCYGDVHLQLFVAQLEQPYGVGEMV